MARPTSSQLSTNGRRHPFWLIDGRLREADFFLTRVAHARDIDEARFMFSAFVSAAVAVRDATRTTLSHVAAAQQWWRAKSKELSADPTFAFFVSIRNEIHHQGLNPVERMFRSHIEQSLFFARPGPDGDDVLRASRQLMALVSELAASAYRQFWSHLDIPASYSLADLRSVGASLEQIEAEFGLPRVGAGMMVRRKS